MSSGLRIPSPTELNVYVTEFKTYLAALLLDVFENWPGVAGVQKKNDKT